TSHTPAFTRIDPTINFNWKSGSPDSRIPKDRFAVRWTGRLLPAASGEYTFQAEVDDQLELEINGKRILWAKQGSSTVGKVTLEAGKMVNITVNYEESWGESFAKLFWTPPGGSRSILPSSVLFPPVNEDSGAELLLDTTEVIDPLGMKRIGRLEAGRRGMKFTVEGTAAPGVYQMTVPSRAADALLAKPGSKIPMVVTRDVAESRLTPLNDDDRALIEKHLDVVDVRNRDDVLAVLSGKGFGEELWKLLAVAAFSLLLLEVALARWISKSRRAGEEVKIDFKNDDDSDQRFMAEFNRVKGEAS
ncbi:MAG: PA14 domain-containing protein, partial [Akkermansiaceae bacterium]